MRLFKVFAMANSLAYLAGYQEAIEQGGWQVQTRRIEKVFIATTYKHAAELAKADLRFLMNGGISWLFPTKNFYVQITNPPQNDEPTIKKRWKLIPDERYRVVQVGQINYHRTNYVRSFHSLASAQRAKRQSGGTIWETSVMEWKRVDD